MKSKFDEAQSKIAAHEADKKAENAVARFNERMDVLDQKFDLEDEDREFLAQELKSVEETEEAFASFQNKMDVVWKHKSKEAKEEFDKQVEARIQEEVQKRLSKNGKTQEPQKTTEEILDSVESTETAVANSNETVSREEQTFMEKFAKAFDRKNIEIS